MRMIKYLLLFVLTMSIISCSKKTAVEDHTNAEAQEIPKGEHIQGKPSKGKSMVDDRIDKMIDVIGMNSEKAEKFREIEKKYKEKRLALRDEDLDQMAKLEKARNMMNTMDAEYKDLLSDEEYMKYRGIMNSKIHTAPAHQ